MTASQDQCVTTIDLLRHGEPVGGKRYRGQLDDPLSELGWSQMRAAVGDHCPWDTILTSPLTRCAAFAEELAARHRRPLQADPRWMEIGFGAWEGRTAAELQREDPEILHRFWTGPLDNRPPGAETLESFHDRVVAAWEGTLASYAGRHVLIVAHAGVIRVVLRHVLQMPLGRLFRIHVADAGLTRIRIDTLDGYVLPRLIFHGGSL